MRPLSVRSIDLLLGFVLFVCAAAVQAAWDPRELAVLEITNQQRLFHGLTPLNGDDRLREAAFGHSQSMSVNAYLSHTTLAGPGLGDEADDRILAAGYGWNSPPPGTIGGWAENIAGGQGYGFINGTPTEFDPIDAARAVMFGTSDLTVLSDFDATTLDRGGFSDWDEVGDTWGDSDWNLWAASRSSSGWMGSAGHRSNILTAWLTDLGVGYVWEPDDIAPIDLGGGQSFPDPLRTYWTQNFAAGDTVVPLPAAFWLFASVMLAGLGFVRRRAR